MNTNTTSKTVKKQRKCCVPWCHEFKGELNHFHPVPADKNRLSVWEKSLGRELTPNMRVCSAHFSSQDYIPSRPSGHSVLRPNLKRIAVPQQFKNNENLISNDMEFASEIDRETREKLSRELDEETPEMIATFEESKSLEEDAKAILSLIKCNAGNRPIDEYYAAQVQGLLGPFTLFQDLQSQLFCFLESHFKDVFNPEVLFSGLLTEVLINAVMELKQFDRKTAFSYLEQTSLKVKIRDS